MVPAQSTAYDSCGKHYTEFSSVVANAYSYIIFMDNCNATDALANLNS